MNDLIKREDAIKVIEETAFIRRPILPHYVIAKIKDIPSAEPKQGEWIYCEDDEGQDGYRCSECGFFVPWHYGHEDINFIYKYHACPSCMARMKGADNEKSY